MVEIQDEPKRKFRLVSYLCAQCRVKRDLVVDQQKHLSRRELTLNGLAPYIDIHENTKDPELPEHGMQIFVDFNFQVRSNNPMIKKARTPNKMSIPGLPTPSIDINQTKMSYKSQSWNSLNLSSQVHNMGLFIINQDPTLTPEDGFISDFESQLKSVSIKVNYRTSLLTEEFIYMSHQWLMLLAKWIELTASLNTILIPRLLIYIDQNVAKAPDESDELSISILMDASAAIKLVKNVGNLQPIKHSINALIEHWKDFKYKNTVLGLNIPIYEFFLTVLNSGKFIEIIHIIEVVKSVEETVRNQFIDTFILTFFDLFRSNNIEYMVSYLM